MKELRSEISIGASPRRVWQVLTDFPSYAEWNPLIRTIEGEVDRGAQLDVFLQPSGSKGAMIHPKVVKAEPEDELRLQTKRALRMGATDYIFHIDSYGANRARFIARVVSSGPFASLPVPAADLQRGMEEMVEALQERVEAL